MKLYTKILLWFFLNLVVLGAAFYAVFRLPAETSLRFIAAWWLNNRHASGPPPVGLVQGQRGTASVPRTAGGVARASSSYSVGAALEFGHSEVRISAKKPYLLRKQPTTFYPTHDKRLYGTDPHAKRRTAGPEHFGIDLRGVVLINDNDDGAMKP